MKARKNRLSESQEDYLEAIYHIVRGKGAARAKDIADRMNVTSASVTGALHALERKDLVNYAPYDIVTLTPAGEQLAERVVKRHEALYNFFVKVLTVDVEAAEQCACRMEHAVPDDILERFVEFVRFMEQCPGGSPKWDGGSHSFTGMCPQDTARSKGKA
ncbi:MAG: metal-dependent transcriptional regulator [Spartobacteria bacterium]|nr:metal-dependent transcriptional regulator [Spartobacteria bacterium]